MKQIEITKIVPGILEGPTDSFNINNVVVVPIGTYERVDKGLDEDLSAILIKMNDARVLIWPSDLSD